MQPESNKGPVSAGPLFDGVAKVTGLLTGTVLAVFFGPWFFVVVRNLFKGRGDKPQPGAPVEGAAAPRDARTGDSAEGNQHA